VKVTLLGIVDPSDKGVMILRNIRNISPTKRALQIKRDVQVVDSWGSFVWPQLSRMQFVTGPYF
jgi:hypothetical protein